MASRYIREFLASEAFKNAGREVSDVVPRLVKFLCCLQVTKTHLFTVTLSYGPSMLPTLGLAGNLCLAERISTRFEKLGVGDIVLVQSPEVPWKFMTKRLKAMEGQSVTYFVDPKNSDKSETIVVPKGHVWMEGDNIYESNDSRKFGPVPYGLLQGRVFWRIWPPKDFGSLAQKKGRILSHEVHLLSMHKVGDHITHLCPYKSDVPKKAIVGSGCVVICKVFGCHFRGSCCAKCVIRLRRAILKDCSICRKLGENRTSDCPSHKRKHYAYVVFNGDSYTGAFSFEYVEF